MTHGIRVTVIVLMILATIAGAFDFCTRGFNPNITLPILAALCIGGLILTLRDRR